MLELEQIEVDHCIQCGGIWVDSGELELLLEDRKTAEHFLRAFRPVSRSREKKRKCPICFKKMEKISCGDDGHVLIDRCRGDHGIWCDRGELSIIFESTGFSRQGSVPRLLKKMFGIY